MTTKKAIIWVILMPCVALSGCSDDVKHVKTASVASADIGPALEQHFADMATLYTTKRESIVNDSSKMKQLKRSTPPGYLDALVADAASDRAKPHRYVDTKVTVEIQSIKETSNTTVSAEVKEETYFLNRDRQDSNWYTCKHAVRLEKSADGTWRVTRDAMLNETGLLPRPVALTFVQGAAKTTKGHPATSGGPTTSHTLDQDSRGSSREKPTTPSDVKHISPSDR